MPDLRSVGLCNCCALRFDLLLPGCVFSRLAWDRGERWGRRGLPPAENCLHQHTATGTGEGVPLQQVSVPAEEGGNSGPVGPDRKAGQGVVPEPAHEAQATNPEQREPQWGLQGAGRRRWHPERRRGGEAPPRAERGPAGERYLLLSEQHTAAPQWRLRELCSCAAQQQWQKSETFPQSITHCSGLHDNNGPRLGIWPGQWRQSPCSGCFFTRFSTFLLGFLPSALRYSLAELVGVSGQPRGHFCGHFLFFLGVPNHNRPTASKLLTKITFLLFFPFFLRYQATTTLNLVLFVHSAHVFCCIRFEGKDEMKSLKLTFAKWLVTITTWSVEEEIMAECVWIFTHYETYGTWSFLFLYSFQCLGYFC